jgi:prepilin-type N-terminal cleavage/methylation domain-containing protein
MFWESNKSDLTSNRGYTLAELAIVVTIIAALIIAASSASSMIRNATSRTIISEFNYYLTGVNNFYAQYNYYPGDMPNATSYWYNASTCPGTTGTAGSCNGNGNGIIQAYVQNNTTGDEQLRAWQHLVLSGILLANYGGTHSTAGQNDIGVNVPLAHINVSNTKAGYTFYHLEAYTDSTVNSLILGGQTSANLNVTPVVPVLDAYYIDSKIDDGIPKFGIIRPYPSDDAAGTTGTGATSGQGCILGASNAFNLSYDSAVCNIQFIISR